MIAKIHGRGAALAHLISYSPPAVMYLTHGSAW